MCGFAVQKQGSQKDGNLVKTMHRADIIFYALSTGIRSTSLMPDWEVI